MFSAAAEARPRVGVRVGDSVLDLAAVLGEQVFGEPSLNAFMAQGPARWADVRARITELLTEGRHRGSVAAALHPLAGVRLHLPFEVGDYVDFYASEHHAANVGRLFRPGGEALMPNWKHLPVGYHGRSGTVVVSGTPVTRPNGQFTGPGGDVVFGPSQRLDFEAEVGFVIGAGAPGPVRVADFASRVFGVFLVNDWSARDLQSWESRPLGPFLAKSFATSISPWVVPLDALEQARISPPAQDPPPLPYLAGGGKWGLDLALEVRLNGQLAARPPFAAMYWTPAADAGPPDRQRRLGQDRGLLCLRHGQRAGPGPARLPAGAELGRRGAAHPARRLGAHLPRRRRRGHDHRHRPRRPAAPASASARSPARSGRPASRCCPAAPTGAVSCGPACPRWSAAWRARS